MWGIRIVLSRPYRPGKSRATYFPHSLLTACRRGPTIHIPSNPTGTTMPWSKNLTTYPTPLQEVFLRVMESGRPSLHTFDTPKEANRFKRYIEGIRYAHMQTRGGPYELIAGSFCTEKVSPTTIRICSVDDTERARIASIALKQRREQDTAAGFTFHPYANLVE